MKKLFVLGALFVSTLAFSQERISLVSVTGEGTVKVVPDEVVIKARVEHSGESASVVKGKNENVVNDIIKFLEAQGIPSKNIRTEYLKLDKQYNYDTKEYFFAANQAISIELKDLAKYEKIMSGLMETGLNRIDGIEFQTSKKEELQAKARKEAMLDAKAKATQLAAAIGQKIGKAHKITEMEANHFQPVYRAAQMKTFDGASKQTIAPGEMKITIKVNVGFILY